MAATGVAYDIAMSSYHCLWDPDHVENPDRWHAVMARCQSLGLIDRCHRLPSRAATRPELELCHSSELLDLLASTAHMDTEQLKHTSSQYDCLYFHHNSWEATLLAAGAAVDLVKSVLSGGIGNGMGILRPPGHHAMREDSCGSCYVNNVAIAARVALKEGVEKVLIVDWDVHHGQATQREFYNDDRVVYVSIHRHEHGFWWPNLREAEYDHVGAGDGLGYNINIPLNKTGNTDADYLAAWHNVVLPIASEFNPDLVLISAGFDPAVGCPEGEQEVSPATFAHLTHSLMRLAQGKLVALLEGGYFLPSLAESAALTMRALLGDPCPSLQPLGEISREMKTTIDNVRIILANHWKCFAPWKNDIPVEPVWMGPPKPDSAPFDIMCPTPPRPQETEEYFKALVKRIIDNTDLSVPKSDLGVTVLVPKAGLQEGVVRGDDVVVKFLNGEILRIIVDPANASSMWNLLSSSSQTNLVITFNAENKNISSLECNMQLRIDLYPECFKDVFQYSSCAPDKSTRVDIPMWKIQSDEMFLNCLHMKLVPLCYGIRPQVLVIEGLEYCPLDLQEYTQQALASGACNRVILLCQSTD